MSRQICASTFISLVLVLFLAACGGGAATVMPDGQRAPQATAPPVVTQVASSATDSALPPLLSEPPGHMIIKDAQMELVVSDVTLAISQISQMAADKGGYVLESQSWSVAGQPQASLRLAVPAATFEASLLFLRNRATQVVKESTSGQDVSAEYVDLQTRLTNLEATSARVRQFLAAAKTVEESLKVNAQLTELEGQIAQIKGQMQYYEGRSAYSTIFVQLNSPATASTAPLDWDPAHTFERASAVLVNFSQGVADLLIWLFVVFGPFALVGLIALFIVRWFSRKLVR